MPPTTASAAALSELIAVARGDAAADLLLAGGRVVNVFTCEVIPASVAVRGGRIAAVLPPDRRPAARRTIDLGGSYLAPGLIDAHMHVESTMLPPSEFVKLAAPHGTTGVVLDPHEIANVLGIPGIEALMRNASGLPMDIRFALSSCVPSCHLETSGARIESADLEPLFDAPGSRDRVVALAEMMNFPGVVNADPTVLAKVALGLSRRIVDGHAPGLTSAGLQAYVAAGISSDHECTTLAEATEKLRLGMHIHIREGSAARNLEALLPAITPANRTRFSFCTDDRHPADLQRDGHIDNVVRRAVGMGLDIALACAIGSFHTARHYGMAQRGAIAPGYHADMIIFDDPRVFRPRAVFFEGEVVAENGAYLPLAEQTAEAAAAIFPRAPVRLPKNFGTAALHIAAPRAAGPCRIRTIGMDPHQLVTENLALDAKVESGAIVSDTARDILKLAVIERHHGGGNIGLGFVKGFGLKHGAIASTVGHDAHNLAIVGVNDDDMVVAARALAEAGGGQCAVKGGKVLAILPLPIAGLMSDQPAAHVIQQQARLLYATHHDLACPHEDAFMPLSFMPLPVIPHLKLSDLGLVDVDQFKIVPLVV